MAFCSLLRLIDNQLQIENNSTTKNQSLLIMILKKFINFFEKQIPRCGVEFLKKWDTIMAQNNYVKQDANIHLHLLNLINPNKLYLFERRVDIERNLWRQKNFQKKVLHSQFDTEFTMDKELHDEVRK